VEAAAVAPAAHCPWAFNQTNAAGTFAKRLVQVPSAGKQFVYVSVGRSLGGTELRAAAAHAQPAPNLAIASPIGWPSVIHP
jgi:hypothetical protein